MTICTADLQMHLCRWKNKLFSRKWKNILVFVSVIFCLFAYFTAKNNVDRYREPIAEIIQVENKQIGTKESTRTIPDKIYEQTIRARILNGSNPGTVIELKNQYDDTRMTNEKYHKGDQVFLATGNGKILNKIRGLKRDAQIVLLLGATVVCLLIFMGKQGLFTILTMVINSIVFANGIRLLMDGKDIMELCNQMVIVFAAVTLLLQSGIHKKTWAAIASTLCVAGMIMLVFEIVVHYAGEIDYSTIEYLGSVENPDTIFRAEILLSGLGAIMDVAIAITSGLDELVSQSPALSFREFFQSGREMGYDIMGTMLNVLLFVFGSSLIPVFLIRMNNGVSMVTIIEQHISSEVCRFLVESIGIILTIPVSMAFSMLFWRLHFIGRWKKC